LADVWARSRRLIATILRPQARPTDREAQCEEDAEDAASMEGMEGGGDR